MFKRIFSFFSERVEFGDVYAFEFFQLGTYFLTELASSVSKEAELCASTLAGKPA